MAMISIIVPVYRVEKYLSECIDSILAQTFTDFELLLIDDGSPDQSGKICDNYASTDKRIRVIHKPNGGASSARNVGLELATGKYIAFVDADDSIAPTMYEEMIALSEKHSVEAVLCAYTESSRAYHPTQAETLPTNVVLSPSEVERKILFSLFEQTRYLLTVWNKLFLRRVIEAHSLRFPLQTYSEDTLFNIAYFQQIQSAIYINKPLYRYRQNNQSITSTYHAGRFELFLKMRNIELELIPKYNFQVDLSFYNSRFIRSLIIYAISVVKQEKAPIAKDTLSLMFKSEEVLSAINGHKTVPIPLRYRIIEHCAKHKWFSVMRAILYLYSFRTK